MLAREAQGAANGIIQRRMQGRSKIRCEKIAVMTPEASKACRSRSAPLRLIARNVSSILLTAFPDDRACNRIILSKVVENQRRQRAEVTRPRLFRIGDDSCRIVLKIR